uniref:Uncharacterized protein n=1 Tax=Faxonius propinquus nudivirus TaxID=3139431 RepID=A0AAU8GE24_9VIRU
MSQNDDIESTLSVEEQDSKEISYKWWNDINISKEIYSRKDFKRISQYIIDVTCIPHKDSDKFVIQAEKLLEIIKKQLHKKGGKYYIQKYYYIYYDVLPTLQPICKYCSIPRTKPYTTYLGLYSHFKRAHADKLEELSELEISDNDLEPLAKVIDPLFKNDNIYTSQKIAWIKNSENGENPILTSHKQDQPIIDSSKELFAAISSLQSDNELTTIQTVDYNNTEIEYITETIDKNYQVNNIENLPKNYQIVNNNCNDDTSEKLIPTFQILENAALPMDTIWNQKQCIANSNINNNETYILNDIDITTPYSNTNNITYPISTNAIIRDTQPDPVIDAKLNKMITTLLYNDEYENNKYENNANKHQEISNNIIDSLTESENVQTNSLDTPSTSSTCNNIQQMNSHPLQEIVTHPENINTIDVIKIPDTNKILDIKKTVIIESKINDNIYHNKKLKIAYKDPNTLKQINENVDPTITSNDIFEQISTINENKKRKENEGHIKENKKQKISKISKNQTETIAVNKEDKYPHRKLKRKRDSTDDIKDESEILQDKENNKLSKTKKNIKKQKLEKSIPMKKQSSEEILNSKETIKKKKDLKKKDNLENNYDLRKNEDRNKKNEEEKNKKNENKDKESQEKNPKKSIKNSKTSKNNKLLELFGDDDIDISKEKNYELRNTRQSSQKNNKDNEAKASTSYSKEQNIKSNSMNKRKYIKLPKNDSKLKHLTKKDNANDIKKALTNKLSEEALLNLPWTENVTDYLDNPENKFISHNKNNDKIKNKINQLLDTIDIVNRSEFHKNVKKNLKQLYKQNNLSKKNPNNFFLLPDFAKITTINNFFSKKPNYIATNFKEIYKKYKRYHHIELPTAHKKACILADAKTKKEYNEIIAIPVKVKMFLDKMIAIFKNPFSQLNDYTRLSMTKVKNVINNIIKEYNMTITLSEDFFQNLMALLVKLIYVLFKKTSYIAKLNGHNTGSTITDFGNVLLLDNFPNLPHKHKLNSKDIDSLCSIDRIGKLITHLNYLDLKNKPTTIDQIIELLDAGDLDLFCMIHNKCANNEIFDALRTFMYVTILEIINNIKDCLQDKSFFYKLKEINWDTYKDIIFNAKYYTSKNIVIDILSKTENCLNSNDNTYDKSYFRLMRNEDKIKLYNEFFDEINFVGFKKF